MKAGFIQFCPKFGDPDFNIRQIKSLLPSGHFDLIVIPELANSGYLFSSPGELTELSEVIPSGKFCKALIEICAEKNCQLVSGICESYNGKFYNSSVLVYPGGEVFTYRKIHLFNEEKKWFEPGDKLPGVYDINTDDGIVKIGMMICFDWVFPETARSLALNGAQIICHPSNLVLTFCQKAMFTRAVENRVFTITANRTGKDVKKDKELAFTGESIIVSPDGQYLARANPEESICKIVSIDPYEALKKNVTPNNDLLLDRRRDLYG